MDLKIPLTKDFVDGYIAEFNITPKDADSDKAITSLIDRFPENKNLTDILLKFSAINTFYSTNIYDYYKMAEHILNRTIDEGLKDGKPEVIENIRTGHGIHSKGNNTDKDFYSFATKYCSWHNESAYPIYDVIIEKLLIEYQKQDKFCQFEPVELRNYTRFKEILNAFKEHYKLTDYTAKDFDKFLWKYGKEFFSTPLNNSDLQPL